MPIFCDKSVKIYTGQKEFTRIYPWDPWQIWGMYVLLLPLFSLFLVISSRNSPSHRSNFWDQAKAHFTFCQSQADSYCSGKEQGGERGRGHRPALRKNIPDSHEGQFFDAVHEVSRFRLSLTSNRWNRMITLCYVFHVHHPLFLLVINASTLHISQNFSSCHDYIVHKDKAGHNWCSPT